MTSALVPLVFLSLLATAQGTDRHAQHRSHTQHDDGTLECQYSDNTDSRIQIDYFIMSKCPDAQVCVQQYAADIAALNGYIDVQFSHIVQDMSEDGSQVKCMHGPSECDGNRQQACIQQQAKARSTQTDTTLQLYNYILCDVKDFKNIPDNAEQCASDTGFDYNVLHNCYNSERGVQALRQSVARTRAAHAKKSCTMTLDSSPFAIHDGVWNTADKQAPNLIQAVCDALNDRGADKPAVCKS